VEAQAHGCVYVHPAGKTALQNQIFELYSNEVYLARRLVRIVGFGKAAGAFFNKSIRDLTLEEAATLAGSSRRPTATALCVTAKGQSNAATLYWIRWPNTG